MYAIVKTGGKQLKVSAGDIVKVEKLLANNGETVSLTEVLMVAEGAAVTVGTPTIQGAAVKATVLEQAKADKVIIFKKRRRQGYRRKQGHRQPLTVLQIVEISAGGKTAKAEASQLRQPKPALAAAPMAAAKAAPVAKAAKASAPKATAAKTAAPKKAPAAKAKKAAE